MFDHDDPSRVRPRSGPWVLAGRGWGFTIKTSGIRVPFDADLGPDPEGLKARTLAVMLGGDQDDRLIGG